jgi:translation initiation factor 5B
MFRREIDVSHQKVYRQPLVAVLGHVDAGKTSLLDYIRKTRVAAKEPGAITQHVGASEVPYDVIKSLCDPIFKKIGLKFEFKAKGLLFIDLPGHEAFTNLRRRGGSLADIAILVVDVHSGVQQQTVESINILRLRKTPFVVALNKIDTLEGWKSVEGRPFIEAVNDQSPQTIAELDRLLYRVVGQLAEMGFDSDRYDRVRDFTKKLAIVPTSAMTGEGIPDLIAVLIGLVQRYMLDKLEISGRKGRGVVLEVRKEPGKGTVVAAILYDGILREGDRILIGGVDSSVITRVRAILRPRPLEEIRIKSKFQRVEFAEAASGIMIVAPDLDKVIPGAPIYVVESEEEAEEIKREIEEEVRSILIRSDAIGVIVRADALGSLEAISGMLQAEGIPIRRGDIGDVSRSDVFEASIISKEDEKYGVILAFNVRVPPDVEQEAGERGVRIIKSNIIYELVEGLKGHIAEVERKLEEKLLSTVVFPAELTFLPGYTFRNSDPAIIGVEVVSGRILPGYPLINDKGKKVGTVLEIQQEGNRKQMARAGERVAISIKGGVVGRNIKEGQVLYTDVREIEDEKLRSLFFSKLSEQEKALYRKILWIKYGKME